ncbi:Putative homeobox-leucine zipper protein ATHB-51 [Frankliniella fusca]|uniref:Homeobox-leucine zipper protein ATHB-51 n=1 Tax=Frankliniella fusca TaxID=407009 RepID=A0AAE1HGM3_9NEOP|nr:Putative homeobox-leucine zipper protein ATHB-51 [Frankliniella fusca]
MLHHEMEEPRALVEDEEFPQRVLGHLVVHGGHDLLRLPEATTARPRADAYRAPPGPTPPCLATASLRNKVVSAEKCVVPRNGVAF